MGELGALFNPGMRHELEERQAKAARREEEGNAKDGDLRIDLESGVAVINAPGQQTTSGEVIADNAPEVRADPAGHSVVAPDSSAERPATQSADQVRDDSEAAADTRETAPDAFVPAATTPARTSPRTAQAAPAGPVIRPRGKRGVSAGR